ncbi:hypothetical protein [Fastidiosibacter lacustris]|uniref:hypothetical protein n=1 Tax=Fastidiosibacter lacustris TaxID=2056695 RepID=UPI000E350646|nr:hypothetical protein [Fastidiosibacter lacustris]
MNFANTDNLKVKHFSFGVDNYFCPGSKITNKLGENFIDFIKNNKALTGKSMLDIEFEENIGYQKIKKFMIG